ncbi:albumin precursor [Xenopus tropicalis]|eukprot:NP_001004887.2 probable cysteine--tRNA ligase, mitochondrial precursor [Xenopus tropicalis]
MKWITLICLLISSSLIESRIILKRDADQDHQKHIADVFNELTERTFKGLTLAIVSQNLQKCSLEELSKLVNEITDFAKSCTGNDKTPECDKKIDTLFYDKLCADPKVGVNYEWTKDCCSKQDPERGECFREHRDVEHTPVKTLSPEQTCTLFKEHPDDLLSVFIHEEARHHPDLYPPAVLLLTKQYQKTVEHCCEEEDKEQCFKEKIKEIMKQTHSIQDTQKHFCWILDTHKERALKAINLARVSHRYPKSDFKLAHTFTEEITHFIKDCCHGDMFECMSERMELSKHTCDHKDELSSKLGKCCDLPVLERSYCIVTLENDEVPAELSKPITEFTEDPHVCEKYAENQEVFLGRYLHAVSRKHQELSKEFLVQSAKEYETLLNKCCKTDNPPDCYKDAANLFLNEAKERFAYLKQNCDALQEHGEYLFENDALIRYAKKMPTVSSKGLIGLAHQMADIGEHCCALPENQRLPCAEGDLSILFGKLCEKQKKNFANDGVAHCCSDSYSGMRSCFTALGPDTNYVPPPVTDDTFHFDDKICTANEKEQQHIKQTFLVKLIQVSPKMEKNHIDECSAEFLKMVQKCCTADEHQGCFDTEKKPLIEHCQKLHP